MIRIVLFALLPLCLLVPALRAQEAHVAPDKAWYTFETTHFTFTYHEGTERTARIAARVAEDVYGPITSLYGHTPDSKVHIVIKDLSDYSNGAAYYYNNKIELWASPLDFELRGTHNWMRNVFAHEFTHIIQMQKAMKWSRTLPAVTLQWFGYERERRNDVLFGYPNVLVSYPIPSVTVPPWMAEGTAQYMRAEFGYEHWDAHRDMILRCYVLSDSMLSWPEMQAFGKTSLGNESVYNAGYNMTRWLAKTYGEPVLKDLTTAFSSPWIYTADGAFQRVLGKSGTEIYQAWQRALREEYHARIAPVQSARVAGRIVGGVGFANLFPAWSPDGTLLAYTSNKTADYFGQSSLFLYDPSTGTERNIADQVSSQLSWSPDGRWIAYSRYAPADLDGQRYYDLYVYDRTSGQSRRLTTMQRAMNPAFSPDGTRIAFVHASDGSVNLSLISVDGARIDTVTRFRNGEQAFTPRWAPSGDRLYFAYAPRTLRAVASIRPDGTDLQVLAGSDSLDCRDPYPSADGTALYYSEDRHGIFNIAKLDLASGRSAPITNVIGGAFMPSVSRQGTLAYAEYTASGYKLAVLDSVRVLDDPPSYLPARSMAPDLRHRDTETWDWQALRAYDDRTPAAPAVRSYSSIFERIMVFPVLRIDQYNRENSGLELLKPGLTAVSSDILQRVEFLASGSINIRGERDLMLSMTFRDKLPLLGALGVYPAFTVDAFNVTRKTTSPFTVPSSDPRREFDTTRVDVSYNLLEFGARFDHPFLTERLRLSLSYRHSRYTSTIGSFRNPDSDILYQAFDNLYFIGNTLALDLRGSWMLPTRDGEINPVGTKLGLHYDYAFNRFNPTGDYAVDPGTGLLTPRYGDVRFHRVEGVLTHGLSLPGGNHALSVTLHGGAILGPPVDDFFNFYAGGITGMQGYTYYALGGNRMARINLTYRVPLLSSMDLRIGHLLFDKLYGGLFFDAGDAHNEVRSFRLSDLKKDVGVELRMENFSYSVYPTRIFFSAAYGLDSFSRRFLSDSVTYGHEWRFYFGILYSFSLTDDSSLHAR